MKGDAILTGGIDILFSTHNGARTLPRMFSAMQRLRPPKRLWRIIAVDNASVDGTRAILNEASQKLPLEIVHAPLPGKLPALQLGARKVAGDYVLFTDDDVEPCPDWLVAYEEAIEADPDATLLGGPINPIPIEPVSPWFEVSSDHHAALFAKSEHSGEDVDAIACIYGPNFMLKTAALDALYQVRAGLGPTFDAKLRNVFPMGGDTAIVEAIVRNGAKVRYVRNASVLHLVRAYQTDLQHMLARAERHGRGFSIRLFDQAKQKPNRMRWIASNLVRYANAKIAEPSRDVATREVFNKLWELHWLLGATKGAMTLGRAALSSAPAPLPQGEIGTPA